mmetsp:Transcript_43351/g.131876  ORF Transcript_43351/g.131876 Transcript_43351/m.131876 type:complete len:117 (-) Transcript_43351:758-1108(-)
MGDTVDNQVPTPLQVLGVPGKIFDSLFGTALHQKPDRRSMCNAFAACNSEALSRFSGTAEESQEEGGGCCNHDHAQIVLHHQHLDDALHGALVTTGGSTPSQVSEWQTSVEDSGGM